MASDWERLDRIHIRDLALRCIIGVYEEERREKQDVDHQHHAVRRSAEGLPSDDVEDTVDYKILKKKVIALVEQSSCRLIEHLAEQIAQACLADPRVVRVGGVRGQAGGAEIRPQRGGGDRSGAAGGRVRANLRLGD